MQEMFTSLSTYGYAILFLYSLGGGMVAIIAAGILSYTGKMDLTTSIIVASIANALGDTMLIYLSRYNKHMIMPYLKNHKRKLAFSHILMKKYGDRIVFIQKFIYGVKTLVPIAIGLTKYSFVKFSILNVISSIVWAVILGVGSFYMGEIFTNAISYFSSHGWIMPIVMFILFASIWMYLQKVTKKRDIRQK
ncbi:DedA family protein [Campylobacter sp. RM16189]|uniref:DedA family protein n=1 Tax=Campylobacter sp. RM16189 TaxID=1705726 RepID=UPI001475D601|nr:DedA family protein [Campylobacter sp. RM16189]